MTDSSGMLAVVLAEEKYENLELHYPRLRLEEAGFQVKVVGPEKGGTYGSKEGYPVTADCAFSDISAADINVLVVPGGFAPDRLRRYPECNQLVHDAWEAGAVVGSICHAGWVPISARIVKGRRMTSVPAIKDDLINAGAEWVDAPCVADGRFISAQVPKDLPALMTAIFEALEKHS